MSSIIRIGSISWLVLLALLAFLCSFQVAEGFKLFKHRRPRPYDDYDISFEDHRETRRIVRLKAAEANWEKFKNSPLFLEPVDDGLTQIPPKQLEFEYEAGRKIIALFKEMASEAIKYKDDFFGIAKLIAKYSFKVINTMIQNRREEMKIEGRHESKKFFSRMADALSKLVDMSTRIMREKDYRKDNVDAKKLEERMSGLLDYADRILEISPVGAFLKWDTLRLHMDDSKHPRHKKDGMEEAADIFAQFRAIGYDAIAAIAKRMVDILRMFSKGEIPQSARHLN